MNIVILGDCPRCSVIKTKMERKNIKFQTITDEDKIQDTALALGIRELPISFVDGEYKTFMEMNKLINEYKGE